MARKTRTTLDEIVRHFNELEDPRSSINLKHPLASVLVIGVCAVLAGADGPTAIRTWAEEKEKWLLKHLDLPHGLPSKDVFRRVLMVLDPLAFQTCFANWLDSLQQAGSAKVLAIDGKTLRGSHDRKNGLGPLHLVSVWASDRGLTLGQVATDAKSNEITAIPELLKLVDISGAIITIDAMGTQTNIAKRIVDSGGEYVLALKGNQGKLHDEVRRYIDDCMERDFQGVTRREHRTDETHHGRREQRTYWQLPVPKHLKGRGRWKNLRTIGVVIRITQRDEHEQHEVQYYISSLPLGVKQFAKSVRSHWGIENTCHWSLDVTYREDASRARHRTLAENLAWLRRFTLGLLKQHPTKDSQVMKRRRCGWNEDYMLQLLMRSTV